GELAVPDELVLAALLHLEQQLLDPVLLVDFEEVLLQPRALVLDRLAVDVAEDHLQKFPDPVEVPPVDAAHPQLALRRARRGLPGREIAFGHGGTRRPANPAGSAGTRGYPRRPRPPQRDTV